MSLTEITIDRAMNRDELLLFSLTLIFTHALALALDKVSKDESKEESKTTATKANPT